MDIKNIYANRLPKSSPKKEKEIARKHGMVGLLLKLELLARMGSKVKGKGGASLGCI